LDPDGKEIPVSQVIMSHKSPNGKVEYLSTIIRDITDRKEAEQALRESEGRFRTLSEGAFEGIGVTEEGQVLDVNDAFAEILGYTRQELLGMDVVNLVAPEDRKLVTEKIRAGFENVYEHKAVRKDGAKIVVEVRGQNILYGGRKVRMTAVRDITDRKRAEKKLLDYQDQLRSLASELSLAEERQRRQIATDLHDHISQALALSLLTLQAFRQSDAPTNVHKLDEVCKTINEMIEHVRSLTFDLSPPTLYKFGLERAIAELADDQLRRHGIAREFFDDKADKPLEDDVRVLLFQSVRELFINIIKHARAHKVRVALRKEGGNIKVCVNDDGIGFDVNKVRSAAGKRVGFGLFNIRERLDYIGGDFKVESQPGNGSRFTLTAPLKTKAIRS
jgi:PAS domain S-box-containing protein